MVADQETLGSGNAVQGEPPQPEFKDQDQQPQDEPQPQVDEKNPYANSAPGTNGYGPIEGVRWLKDQAGLQFAAMSLTSDNPGIYVRQAFDLNKKIDGMNVNLSLEDAKHVWENTFMPQFDGMKVKQVEDQYDERGKKLLDQIYAPLGHGETRPTWDQIPQNERIAGAAYALASMFTGRGGAVRALTGLSRIYTRQEAENVKAEAQKQETEKLRRQELTEQFNVLMGNKKAEVSQIELSQREGAQQRLLDSRQAEAEKKQKDHDVNFLKGEWGKFLRSGADSKGKLAGLAEYEKGMRDITGDPNWKAPKEDYDAASSKSSQELAREAVTTARQHRDALFQQEAGPKLEKLHLDITREKGLIRFTKDAADALEYKAKYITPWLAKDEQEKYLKDSLTVDKLNNEKLHGWVSTAKDSTILTDAQGKPVLDAGGHVIKTLGEARAKVADLDSVLSRSRSEIEQDLVANGFDRTNPAHMQALAQVQSQIRTMLQSGVAPDKIAASLKQEFSSTPGANLSWMDGPDLDRLVANEKQQMDNDSLRMKIGSASQDRTSSAPASPKAGGGRYSQKDIDHAMASIKALTDPATKKDAIAAFEKRTGAKYRE